MIARLLAAAIAALLLGAAPAAAGEPDATAPAYDVALTGSDNGFRWTGRETITVTNPGAAPLEEIWVRLWGNGGWGCRGQRHVRIANVAGATAGALSTFCSAVPLRLAAPLAPGARGSVSFDVDIRVPDTPGRFGHRKRIALLSNAIPALAHLEGGGVAPGPLLPARRGVDVPGRGLDGEARRAARRRGRRPGRRGARRHPAARARPRLLVRRGAPALGRRHGRRGRRDRVGRARQRSAGLDRVLRIARKRLGRLTALFGPYGWPDLQIVVTDDAAMEHTGLIMTPPQDFVITHELAHEWWYALVGNDQATEPWLDEAFASYSEEAAGAQGFAWCRRPGRGTRVVTRGTAYFRARRYEGYGLVYAEGACLLDVLRKRMGRDRFGAALRGYVDANRHGWSTGAEFRAAMDAASPVPLGDLWRRYRVG